MFRFIRSATQDKTSSCAVNLAHVSHLIVCKIPSFWAVRSLPADAEYNPTDLAVLATEEEANSVLTHVLMAIDEGAGTIDVEDFLQRPKKP